MSGEGGRDGLLAARLWSGDAIARLWRRGAARACAGERGEAADVGKRAWRRRRRTFGEVVADAAAARRSPGRRAGKSATVKRGGGFFRSGRK